MNALVRNTARKFPDNRFEILDDFVLFFGAFFILVSLYLLVDFCGRRFYFVDNLVHLRLEFLIRRVVQFTDSDTFVVESLAERIEG